MNLFQLLTRSAKLTPHAGAVALGEAAPTTYLELAARAARLSASLTGRLGLARGERVAIVAKN